MRQSPPPARRLRRMPVFAAVASFFLLAGNATRVLAQASNIINPALYPSIQAALNACGSSGGGVVDVGSLGSLTVATALEIPANCALKLGADRVTVTAPQFISTMGSGAALLGAGIGQSQIQFAGGAAFPSKPMISTGTDCASVTISGVTLDGSRSANAAPGVDGVRVGSRSSRFTLKDSVIENFTGNGVELDNVSNSIVISGNTFFDDGEDGVNNSHAIFVNQGAGTLDGLRIENNRIDETAVAAAGAEGIKLISNCPACVVKNVWETGNHILLGKSASGGGWGIENWNRGGGSKMYNFDTADNYISAAGGPSGAQINGDAGISFGGNDCDQSFGNVIAHNHIAYAAGVAGGLGIENICSGTTIADNILYFSGAIDADAQTDHLILRALDYHGNVIADPHGNAGIFAITNSTGANIADMSIANNAITQPTADGIALISNSAGARTMQVNVTGNSVEGSRFVSDGALTAASRIISSATASFTPFDVGRLVIGAGIPAGDTIASVINSTTAMLSVAATSSARAQPLRIANTPGRTGIIAAGSGIRECTIARNLVSNWGDEHSPNDGWGLQIVNSAVANVVDNHYFNIHWPQQVQQPARNPQHK